MSQDRFQAEVMDELRMQEEWHGLTDDEISDIYCSTPARPISNGDVELMFDFAKAIEAKLKEKNCGLRRV